MEYFILEVDNSYVPPNLNNWFGVIDKKTLSTKKYYEMSKKMIFTVTDDMRMTFTDLILHPCFMVSKEIKNVITMYDSSIKFTRIILLHQEKKRNKIYYIPFLETVDALTENSKLNIDRSVIYYAELDEKKLLEKVLVQLGGINHICILGRLDFVESLLRRNIMGIGLKETVTK